MENKIYIGVVHKDKNSDYGVSFPDFPGCTSAGSDFEELLNHAQEALQGHIEVMVEYGDPVPGPSSIEDILEDKTAVAMIPIPVKVPKIAVKRFNITAREADMKVIDNWLKRTGKHHDRSSFLVQSAMARIQQEKQHA